jgi:hypothetical protein
LEKGTLWKREPFGKGNPLEKGTLWQREKEREKERERERCKSV